MPIAFGIFTLIHSGLREINTNTTMVDKYGSKAAGEPPLMLAISVYEALRDAVASVKADGQLVEMIAPTTAENVLQAIA